MEIQKMIDPKSLRIGNTVTIENPEYWPQLKGIPMTVTAYREAKSSNWPNSTGNISVLAPDGKQYHQLSEFIQPIPLSEQELIRLGFKGDSLFGTQTLFRLNNVEIWAFRNDNTFLLDNIKRKKVFLKYVHDVQNAFQLIEQTELTYKVENETIKP